VRFQAKKQPIPTFNAQFQWRCWLKSDRLLVFLIGWALNAGWGTPGMRVDAVGLLPGGHFGVTSGENQ
jgi:hypothetical protein